MKFFTTALLLTLGLAIAYIHTNQKEQSFGRRLASISRQVNSMQTTWTARTYSQFEDLDLHQARLRTGFKVHGASLEAPRKLFSREALKSLPESFDAREAWPKCQTLKEIRDQTDCGSCWANAAVEAISDRICIHSGQRNQTRISATDLMACCSSCGSGCGGGSNYPAWLFWKHEGLVTGGNYGDKTTCQPYPLKPCKGKSCPATGYSTPKCTRKCIPEYPVPYEEDKHYGEDIYSLSGEDHIAAEIVKNGPVEVFMRVYEDFHVYKSGVYQHVIGNLVGEHSIKAIGYGVDQETGLKYWWIANSWGYDWGIGGFFKIIRGVNMCAIEAQAIAGVPV